MPMTISRRDALARLAAIGAAAFVLPLDGFERNAARPFDHPAPRPGITAGNVLTAEKVGDRKKEVLEAYEYARAYPEIFDGIYCPCDCKKGMGHRSLLSCYETAQ